LRTGFDTAKGGLVRSILFPKPHQFEFVRDSCAFVGLLAVIGIITFGTLTCEFDIIQHYLEPYIQL